MDLEAIAKRWPGREEQIRALAIAMGQPHELTQPIVVHGPSGTGKSGVLADLLAASGCPHILVDVALCPTVRAANCDALEQLSALLRSGGVNGASAPAGASASASADADADTPIAPVAASTAAIAKRPAVRGDGLATFCASLRAHFGGNSLGGVGEGAARRPRTLYVVYERAERLADGSAAAAAFNTWGAERGGAHACGGFASALLSLRQLAGNANVCAIFVCRAPWARYAQIAAAAAPVLVRFPQYTPAQLESILLQHPPPPPTLPTPPAAAPTTTTTAAAADVLAVRKAHWRPFVHVFVSIASEQALHLPTLLARAPPLFNSFVAPLLTEAAAGGAGAGASTAALLARARPLLRQLGKALYAGDPTEGAALHDLHAAEPALGMSRAAADAARAGGGSAGGSAAAGSKRARGAAGDESGDESEEAEEAAMTTPPRASAQPAAPPQFNSGPDRGLELPLQGKQLLLAAFLASRLPAAQDAALFATSLRSGRAGCRRRASAGGAAGLAASAADGAGARAGGLTFALERLLAIYGALAASAGGPSQPLGPAALLQIASLCGLGLLARATPAEALDGVRLRCEAPAELVAKVAANLKFPLDAYVRLDGLE